MPRGVEGLGIIFWSLVVVILTHYLLFPIAIWLFSLFRPVAHPCPCAEDPKISLIIAAYNEAAVINAKLENCLALEYPPDNLEIIVVADGSTDKTVNLVKAFDSNGIRLHCLYSRDRQGKAAALNRAVSIASGEWLVFSDANSFFSFDALKKLSVWFGDPKIGGVTGRKAILEQRDRESSRGDRLFWDVEARLKTAESRLGSIPTGDGEIFAVRRRAFKVLDSDMINDDTAITLDLIQQGLRVIYEPRALSEEKASISLEDDFRVKARMVLGGFQIMGRYRKFLFPPRTGFAIQFLVHKTLRHLMPVFLLLLLMASIPLAFRGELAFYRGFLLLQSIFYLLAVVGFLTRRYVGNANHASKMVERILYLPVYYCYMNLAALKGLFYFLSGTNGVAIWRKAVR